MADNQQHFRGTFVCPLQHIGSSVVLYKRTDKGGYICPMNQLGEDGAAWIQYVYR